MTAAAIDQDFAPVDFQEPVALLLGWPSSDHRNALRVARNAQILIAELRFVADLRVTLSPTLVESAGLDSVQGHEESKMRMVLQAMRNLHGAIRSDIAVRTICRDLKRFAPHLEKPFMEIVQAASAQLREMRSVLAFMLDETDDHELGVELVPAAGEPMPPEDSRPATL